jgi:BirA family biotin operon repressor/biotin-[acetyl-CoA-carboxylase] ligase
LSTRAASVAGPDIVALASVDSTNAEALRRAPGLIHPTWIFAEAQTAARGRRGRPWAMPPGNFAATLLIPDPGAPAQAALRSFVAALALADALAAVAPGAGVTLKWPNDVLLNGGKVAGILLEVPGGAGSALAVGIGVNLAAAPDAGALEPGALAPVSVAGETGVTVAPRALLDHLAPAFAGWDARLAAAGFAPLRDAWTARAAHIGQPITARMMAEAVNGVFDGIAEDGALLLRTRDGTRRIHAADVFF